MIEITISLLILFRGTKLRKLLIKSDRGLIYVLLIFEIISIWKG